MDKNINQRCFHCGADEMLHQADTDRCPANGQESGNVGATGWRDTIFTLPPERPAEAPASSGLRAKAEKVVNQWEAYVTIKDRNVKFAAEGLLDDDMKELRAALSSNLKDR